jgi:glycosyltransferase involved in cell wall biosynthesis
MQSALRAGWLKVDAKVSVVIPCHDSAAWLPATVASVVAQTLAALEIILVDDGSTDDTRSVIDRLVAEHRGRSLTALSQPNAGVAAARNRGIAAARGRYILPVDADDLIVPTMAEACAALLDADARIAVVYPDREDFGALAGVVPSGRFALARLKYWNQLPYCAMYRRSMWQAVGGYRCNVDGFDDWDFWLAAAALGFCGHHLAQPMLRHRRRAGSQLGALIANYERLHATIVLNNRRVYSASEIAAAQDYLAGGKPAPFLALSRRIFLARYPLPETSA